MAERGALTKRPRTVKDTSDLGLEPGEKVTVKHFEGGRFLSWQSPLGRHMQNVKSSPSMVVHMNLIRAARAALPAAVRARHRPNPDNYIDPRLVPVSDARRLGFDFLQAATDELVRQYCAITSSLYEYPLQPAHVLFTVNEIELAWDVHSPEGASLAARRFEDAWNRSLSEGRHVFEVARLERGRADGMLKAVGKKGEILKMYAKDRQFLRFEAQLTKGAAKRLAGARLDPRDIAAFRNQLNNVAARVFPEILSIQREAGERPSGSLVALLVAALTGKHAPRILDPLLTNGSVKIFTPDSSGRDVLERLRDHGVAQIGRRKGEWVLTPAYAHVPDALRRVDKITTAGVAS
jgi:hypothetical protein